MEMIALQAVKCMAVLRTLCGHCATRLLNPLVEEQDRGGEESTWIHARLVNNTGYSLLSYKCTNAIKLYWFHFFLPILALCQSIPIQQPGKS